MVVPAVFHVEVRPSGLVTPSLKAVLEPDDEVVGELKFPGWRKGGERFPPSGGVMRIVFFFCRRMIYDV